MNVPFPPFENAYQTRSDIVVMNLVDERELLILLIPPRVIFRSTQLSDGILISLSMIVFFHRV